jgi:hypothetical protein
MLPASLLPQNPLIVLFRVDESFNRDSVLIRLVRNQVLFESPDPPQPDSRVFPAGLAGNPHPGHARKFGVCLFDSLTKALRSFEAGVLGQISVMGDEILPRGGALNDPRHGLW